MSKSTIQFRRIGAQLPREVRQQLYRNRRANWLQSRRRPAHGFTKTPCQIAQLFGVGATHRMLRAQDKY